MDSGPVDGSLVQQMFSRLSRSRHNKINFVVINLFDGIEIKLDIKEHEERVTPCRFVSLRLLLFRNTAGCHSSAESSFIVRNFIAAAAKDLSPRRADEEEEDHHQ